MSDEKRIIGNAREMLGMARHGLDEIPSGDPTRYRPGLMNLITHGRSVTLVMQTLSSKNPDFKLWWQPYQQKMKADPLMQYMNAPRVAIFHRGELTTSSTIEIGMSGPVNSDDLRNAIFRNAPPNTESAAIGDRSGSNHYIVRMPDGSRVKQYFALPGDVDIVSWVEMQDAPTEHYGHPIKDKSIQSLAGIYFETLSSTVDEFEARFG